MKWSISRWKCRHNYQDGCRPVWLASPPDDHEDAWIPFEFDTWAEAMAYVNIQLRGADHG